MNKKDIKNILIILGICIIATIVGFFFGRSVKLAEGNGVDFSAIFVKNEEQIMTVLTGVYVIISAVTFLVTYLYIGMCKSASKRWDGEDEDVINRIEHRLNVPMIVSSIMMILNMLLMPICFLYADNAPQVDKFYAVGVMAQFIINYIWIIASNEMAVRLERKLNPEKCGSVLELNFQKKWESGLDEAEKLIAYKAAYKAVKVTSRVCLGLWVVSFIGMSIWDTGALPIIMVCAIWMVLTLTCMLETMRLER